MSDRLYHYLRYDWPLHFILLFVNWLPDNVFCLRLRGMLVRPFLGYCGSNVNIGRNVTFHNPALIHIGSYVHISYGCMLMATDHIWIEDQVLFGPYCILISGNHTRQDGSFRFGAADLKPITIGYGSWLGAHVVVTAGVTVGRGSLLAANAVITHDIAPNTMSGGVPARALKTFANDTI